MDRKCPKCGKEMAVDYEKYINAVVWVCRKCGKEIYICDRSC